VSLELPAVDCPGCGLRLVSAATVIKTATRYADCLRRCDICGIGFSNRRTNPTTIYRSPEQNVPETVRPGVVAALGQALNVQHRPDKLAKFGCSTSEDALTWTVFAYLVLAGKLAPLFRLLGVVGLAETEPTALFWGAPFPLGSARGGELRRRLIAVCDRLGENPACRSEPDVILDFADVGLVVIEVKYLSRNERKAFGQRYDRYVSGTSAFTDVDAIALSELYELTRNWRIGCELAADRPFALLNLVATLQDNDVVMQFCSGLNTEKGYFRTILWDDFLASFQQPLWLTEYLRARLEMPPKV